MSRRRRGSGRTTRLPDWLCFACGHHCSAASSLFDDVAPQDGDLNVCINCATIGEFRGGTVVPFSDFGRLSPEERRNLTETQMAVRAMHREVGRPGDVPKWGRA